MTFLSIYWLGWMLITISIYWLLPNKWRNHFLTLISLAFFVSVDITSAILLCILTIFSYTLDKVTNKSTIISIIGIISILFYYKYRVSLDTFDVAKNIVMPIGLSYYAFRIIHYLVEKSRKTLPDHRFIDYVNYLFFLPTFLVGPIHRFTPFFNDFKNKKWDSKQLSRGMERILFGYFKITVIGNFLISKYFLTFIDSLEPSLKPLALYLGAVSGSLNLYFQFSGYSDIAIGFSLMLGYQVMENFNFPFFKKNIAEFWRSWHMSLTYWSRDYLYMTVVGMTRNPYFATIASFLFIGIWHELSLRYLIWGLYHGIGIIFVGQFGRYLRKNKIKPTKNKILKFFIDGLKIMATCNYFFFGYIITLHYSFADALISYWIILFSWWI